MILDEEANHPDPLDLESKNVIELRCIIEQRQPDLEDAGRVLLKRIAEDFSAGRPVDERCLRTVEKVEQLRGEVLVLRQRRSWKLKRAFRGSLLLSALFISRTIEYTKNMKTMTTIRYGKGKEYEGYLATPEKAGTYPALILIHEIWGLDAHTKNVSDRFAEQGFVVLAPDLLGDTGILEKISPSLYADLQDPEKRHEAQDARSYAAAFHQRICS
jgi:hypothetical protein